jgi:peptidoglycan/LPS O-acetylase OafA/YrhL
MAQGDLSNIVKNWRKSFFGNRGFGVNMLASFCFIMLAVYGWGLGWQEVGKYLLIIICLLAALLIPALLLGLLLRKIRK